MRRALITGIAGQDGSDIGLLDDELAGRLVRIDRP
jgi:GDP-D-mannose dehydratase